jgi:uncharacterized membrane protein YhhN
MPRDTTNRILLGVSIAAAILYYPAGGWVVAKGLTVSMLAVIAFRSRLPLLGIGLAFGSLGDVLLDIDPPRFFVFGLGAFLLGHLTYTQYGIALGWLTRPAP